MLEPGTPDMTTLFDQLGLDSSEAAIDAFVAEHKPLDAAIALVDAPFWTPAQGQFIAESIDQDAAWAIVVDELDARLRAV